MVALGRQRLSFPAPSATRPARGVDPPPSGRSRRSERQAAAAAPRGDVPSGGRAGRAPVTCSRLAEELVVRLSDQFVRPDLDLGEFLLIERLDDVKRQLDAVHLFVLTEERFFQNVDSGFL